MRIRRDFHVDRRMALSAVQVIAILTGCSGRPSRVPAVYIDATDSARRAITTYDTDGDGKLADKELRSVPGIFKWKILYDLDADGSVSEEEIRQRIEKWQSDNLGFCTMSANVKLNGRPVSGVRVELTPEPYLGAASKPAFGVTNKHGYATLAVASNDLPDVLKRRGVRIAGIYAGTYKINLSHPQRRLPETNAQGVKWGDEIARDTIDSSIDIELATR